MNRLPISVLLVTACVAETEPEVSTIAQGITIELYASPNGTSTTCTSPSTPCSLVNAQARARALIPVSPNPMTGDIRVNVMDGVYELSAPLVFQENATSHDSGKNGFKVVYQAATSARPIISGGRKVTGWNMYDSTLGIYYAPLPVSGMKPRALYVNGARAVRAQVTPVVAPQSLGACPGSIPVPPVSPKQPNPVFTSTHFAAPTTLEFVIRRKWFEHRCRVSSATQSIHNTVATGNITATNFNYSASDWLLGGEPTYYTGDFNGDGKTDLLLPWGGPGWWYNDVYLSTGGSFVYAGDWAHNVGRGVVYRLGDYNGDGKTDILFPWGTSGSNWHNEVYLSNGTSFNFSGDWLPNNGYGVEYRVGDFTGDGKTDILFAYGTSSSDWHNYIAKAVWNGTSGSFQFTGNDWLPNVGHGRTYRLGDFTGDNRVDILMSFANSSGWHNYVYRSQLVGGTHSFAYAGDWAPGVGAGMDYVLGKFNSDSRTDILFPHRSGGVWHNNLRFSTGSSFANGGDWNSTFGHEHSDYIPGNFDGMYKDDVLVINRRLNATLAEPCISDASDDCTGDNGNVTWIENAYELLDTPGEWFSDGAYLYYIPLPGQNIYNVQIVVPYLEKLIVGSGMNGGSVAPTFLENLSFVGLTFAYSNWERPHTYGFGHEWADLYRTQTDGAVQIPGALQFETAKAIRLERNVFVHLGASGATFTNIAQNIAVVGNRFEDISAAAIRIGDSNVLPSYTTGGDQENPPIGQRNMSNVCENNYISQAGVEFHGSPGIVFGFNEGASIAYNEVRSLPYSGIISGAGYDFPQYRPPGTAGAAPNSGTYAKNNSIHHNKVQHVMQELADGGGVYTQGYQRSSSVTNNLVSVFGVYDSAGIYHDQGSRYFVDNNNVIQSSSRWLEMPWATVLENQVYNNYVDVDLAHCYIPSANAASDGPSANCNYGAPYANSVTMNTFGLPWPPTAVTIINASGLEASFAGIKNPFCGDATCTSGETPTNCSRDCGP